MDHVTSTNRLASIDVLRAVIMVLMIFVNDLWSLNNVPQWLEHVPADADGMGLADIVFPAFLVIVGMSIPFAVANRRKKGDNNSRIIIHIIGRSFALIVMGLFLVNGEYINEEASGINRLLWNTLSCVSFILLWNNYSVTADRKLVLILKAIAIVMLMVLAVLYKPGTGDEVRGFTTYWWGILGLIGWAYLICGILYVWMRGRLGAVLSLWIVFNILCVISHYRPEWIEFTAFLLSPFGEGAMPSFVMGGTLASMTLIFYRNKKKEQASIGILVASAILLLALGFLSREYWGISKIRATPSWVWICTAITILIFLMLYWIVDKKGKGHIFSFIRAGGTNTLICYLIPYFAYAFMSLIPWSFPEIMLTGMLGLVKSFTFAVLVVGAARLFEKWHVQLKL